MALGILLTLTVYSIIVMMILYTDKVEREWDSQQWNCFLQQLVY